MAQMHPDDIEGYEKTTKGEKRVFRFIREAARPHKDFICWYEPQLEEREKSPILFCSGKSLGSLS